MLRRYRSQFDDAHLPRSLPWIGKLLCNLLGIALGRFAMWRQLDQGAASTRLRGMWNSVPVTFISSNGLWIPIIADLQRNGFELISTMEPDFCVLIRQNSAHSSLVRAT
jgi:hypothetical protein